MGESNAAFDGRAGEIVGRQVSTGSWIGAVVVVLGLAATGVYLARKAMHDGALPGTPPAVSASAATSPVDTPVAHPIEQARVAPASASTAALPPLDDSDTAVASALASIGGDLSSLLIPRQIITRIVTTIDALPRRDGLGSFTLPAHTPKGAFAVGAMDGATVVVGANDARYAPYMQVVDATDPQALVAWYVHAYPLFQQAYRQLGYPKGYFNDRLIMVIDDLLAAPEPAQPPVLVRAEAFYVYSDPALESLSTGQKLLLRVGPGNALRIKAKLRAIRAQLVGRGLNAASAAASD